jgi:two-component system, OmpR family, phosphate regulon sensor histidine kinase PhoR
MRHSISAIVLDPEDPNTLEGVREALADQPSEIIPCPSEEVLLDTVVSSLVDVLVISLERPFERSFALLSEIHKRAPEAEVIFVASFDDETLWAWMEVIQRGAYEFLPKPFQPAELKYHLLQATKKHLPDGFLNDPNSTTLNKGARAGA